MRRSDRRRDEAPGELIYGVHPVSELLHRRPGEIERLYTAREARGPVGRLLRLAREAGVPVTYLSRDLLRRKVGVRGADQGVAAVVAPVPYADCETLCRGAAADPAGWLVVLDGVVDPGNLGAALRSCAAAGVGGVILGSEAGAGLGPVVAKTSAGAVERVAVARESRLGPRLEWCSKRGFSVVGLVPRAATDWDDADYRGRLVLVAGGEERGIRPGLRRRCNQEVAIPMAGGVESLNVSVALGVLLFEALRQRRGSRRS